MNMKIAMKWFEDNSVGANPRKFQMFLGTKGFTKKCLNINGNTCIYKYKSSILLLGVTIDWKLNFNTKLFKNKLQNISEIQCYVSSNDKHIISHHSFILVPC